MVALVDPDHQPTGSGGCVERGPYAAAVVLLPAADEGGRRLVERIARRVERERARSLPQRPARGRPGTHRHPLRIQLKRVEVARPTGCGRASCVGLDRAQSRPAVDPLDRREERLPAQDVPARACRHAAARRAAPSTTSRRVACDEVGVAGVLDRMVVPRWVRIGLAGQRLERPVRSRAAGDRTPRARARSRLRRSAGTSGRRPVQVRRLRGLSARRARPQPSRRARAVARCRGRSATCSIDRRPVAPAVSPSLVPGQVGVDAARRRAADRRRTTGPPGPSRVKIRCRRLATTFVVDQPEAPVVVAQRRRVDPTG